MTQSRRALLVVVLLVATVSTVLLLAVGARLAPVASWHQAFERTPGELIRFAKRRLEGHDRLEAVLLPALGLIQRQIERETPSGQLPSLGKGQQAHGLRSPGYGAEGVPLQVRPASEPATWQAADLRVSSPSDMARAMAEARPGQSIEVEPGDYAINQRLMTGGAGTKVRPIILRAAHPGDVVLRVTSVEAIVVNQPYWTFENLTLRGVCSRHSGCEHAFHVVGKARGTTLRNNRIEDFNAHVKVNGEDGFFPDDGLVQFNTLMNTGPRQTDAPVTPIDIVAASGWVLADNLVANFVKAGGDGVSYGLYMKGAGSGGRIERNLVICSPTDISQPGVRVGISLGGGGTARENCRDGQCVAEHSQAKVVNNVVAHCNDFGIDVFRSSGAVVAYNTLLNTAGIDVRRPPASAEVVANVLDGRIRSRDGGIVTQQDNIVADLPAILENPDVLAMRWVTAPSPVPLIAGVRADFCGDLVGASRLPGAVGQRQSCEP